MADEWTNVTITKGTLSINIQVTNDEEILNKMLTKITFPTSSNDWGSGKKATKFIDLLRIEERINIDGKLVTDTTSTSSVKKADLKSAFKSGGVMTMTYEGDSVTGQIEKLQIVKDVSDGTEPVTDEVGYTVKFTFIRGEDI